MNEKKLADMFVEKSDVRIGIEQLHERDKKIVSRLGLKNIKSLLCISYLQNLKVDGLDCNFYDNMDGLIDELITYSIGLEGKSREEIIQIFQAMAEAKRKENNFNMLGKIGEK